MPRTTENPKITNRTQRAKLKALKNGEAYWHLIAQGQHVGYCKSVSNQGTWRARLYTKEFGRRFQALGNADDTVAADGINVLNFEQAVAAANAWFVTVMRADGAEVSHNSTYTVADALDHYIAEKEREKRKPQARARIIAESHIKPALGNIQLNKLTHGKVKAWRDALAASAPRQRTGYVMAKVIVKTLVNGELKDRLKPRATDVLLPQAFRNVDTSDPDVQRKRQATANRILTVLKAALNFAHEERKVSTKAGWEAVKPFRKVDVPKIRFLAMDEVSTLIPACEAHFAKLVKGALMSGCRYGELTVMPIAAFDAENGRVYVAQSKNGESRYVDLNDEGIAFFASMTAKRDGKELIFLKANGKPWMKSEQKRPMDAACESTGIQDVTFHILRHTYASHAVMNGMPIAVLSEQLGHKDTRITERHYAHLSKSYKRKLIRENAPSFGFMPLSAPGPQLVARAS